MKITTAMMLVVLNGYSAYSQSAGGLPQSIPAVENSDSTRLVAGENNKNAADTFYLYSLPIYDAEGNVMSYRNSYDHVPTSKDSVEFFERVKTESHKKQAEAEEESRRHPPPPPVKEKKAVQYAKLHPREGKHLFSLHWVNKPDFGSVLIKKLNDSTYSVKGEHRNKEGDYATLSGFLTPVAKGEMLFEGVIATRLLNMNPLTPCFKTGKMKFYCKPGRKYWRLQQFTICEGDDTAGYYDIFF
jgi:hypothetical protein